jgi:membrane fusion protein, multidrug efflux system
LSKARPAALIAFVFALTASAVWIWPRHPPAAAPARPAPASIPVSIAPVVRSDVPVFLTGLGAVQASQTIAIHPQVEGELVEVLFTEGQQVKKGDVLARIEPRLFKAALDQATSKKAENTALLIAAEKYLNRFATLAQRDIVSRQDVEQQQAKFDQLKASIAADDAAIAFAQTQLDYTQIRAPSDGRVGIRLIDRGNIVRPGAQNALTTLVVTRPSGVVFTLPASSLDDVRAAMARGTVEVTAFDQDNVRELARGKLLLIDNSVDPATATIRLKAMFDNVNDRLWPGQFVNARVLLETRHDALTIPSTAVQRGPQGVFAWVVSDEESATTQPIELGPANDRETIVIAGLEEGDEVVTEGQYRLRPSARITRTPSPARAP